MTAGSHEFASSTDMATIALNPPAGATGLTIKATVHRGPEPAGTVRLFHLRKKAPEHAKIAATEVVEILYSGPNRVFTAGFSGFGAKHAHAQVQHMGEVSGDSFDVTITVPLGAGEASVAVGPLSAHDVPDVAAVGPLELLLGFDLPGVALSSPAGWSISWEEGAITWLGAGSTAPTPSAPPAAPPVAPPATIDAPGLNGPVLSIPTPHQNANTADARVAFAGVLALLLKSFGVHLSDTEAATVSDLATQIGEK